MEMHDTRVWVTGIGAITPLGYNMADTWNALVEGRSGITTIDSFDPDEYGLKVKIAGEVKDFNPERWIEQKEIGHLDRFSQFALVAAEEAVRQSGLNADDFLREEAGVLVGTGIGGFHTTSEQLHNLWRRGSRTVRPLTVPKLMPNAAASALARHFNCRGPCTAISTACASGADAIGQAMRLIRAGDARIVIAGGSDAIIIPFGIAVFQNMKALAENYNATPDRASRPFDHDRSGFVVAEGASILVLEDAAFATARGARPLVEISGYGQTTDVHHITAPDPKGAGAIRAMQKALHDARAEIGMVRYINTHGTGTPINDVMETLAIRNVMGSYADSVPVSAIKSATGHLLGAAGALEAAICVRVIETGLAPHTQNLDHVDSDCELLHIRGRPRTIEAGGVILSNAFGFGGHNAVLVLRAP